jgi:hypothetical protein
LLCSRGHLQLNFIWRQAMPTPVVVTGMILLAAGTTVSAAFDKTAGFDHGQGKGCDDQAEHCTYWAETGERAGTVWHMMSEVRLSGLVILFMCVCVFVPQCVCVCLSIMQGCGNHARL